eukprot:CAMPEP_0118693712 /NCGR_PEP_ID=MMETSP0800-20121206/12072_1 /TAXON_ID=210618 ORGANISM="Striatella unipunctata, Strain CCMP2910" /NCGR_SAMPLE_ID=MMETSP0800 /ASSEMBLY_ACC=CAM_ASM_000638 /LENGTH=101 /DNA_ID=CAMNT_0006592001 /DNA_START=483 /DNA_END=788 /DNA_ORIENTATION=+
MLGVTPEQSVALKDSIRVAKELDSCLGEALAVLEELKQRLARSGDDLEKTFNNLRDHILSPSQTGEYLLWVNENAACMELLDVLWNRPIIEGSRSMDSGDE